MISLSMQHKWLILANDMANKEISAIKESLANGTLKAPLFQTNQKEDIILGHIGELALKYWLNQERINFEESPHILGQSDEYDIKINNVKIDIKTNLRKQPLQNINETYKAMINQKQLGKHGEIILFIMAHGYNVYQIKEIKILGWLRTKEIKQYPINNYNNSPCYWIPIEELNEPRIIEYIEEKLD